MAAPSRLTQAHPDGFIDPAGHIWEIAQDLT